MKTGTRATVKTIVAKMWKLAPNRCKIPPPFDGGVADEVAVDGGDDETCSALAMLLGMD